MLVHSSIQSCFFDDVDEVQSPAMNFIAEGWAEEWAPANRTRGGEADRLTTTTPAELANTTARATQKSEGQLRKNQTPPQVSKWLPCAKT